jgi:hypothetical protein
MPTNQKPVGGESIATSQKLLEAHPPGRQATVTEAAAAIKEPTDLTGFFANPVYAGGATWLGTVLSVIAAWVAFKQARAAISAAKRVQLEQQRKYVESAQRAISILNQVARPVVSCSSTDRGIKFAPVVMDINIICHDLLSSSVDKVLPQIPVSIKNIERDISKIAAAFDAAKANPIKVDYFHELQQSIKGEIQFLSRICTDYFDQAATKTD